MKWVIAILVLITIFVCYGLYETSDFRVAQSKQAGMSFAKICSELNGKPFTLETITKLNGFVDLNGNIRPAQKDLDDYLRNQMASEDAFFAIYHQAWFQSFGVEHTWYCYITRNEDNSIKAKPIFHVGD